MNDDAPEPRELPTEPVPSLLDRLLAPFLGIFAALIGGILGGLMTAFARAFGLESKDDEDEG